MREADYECIGERIRKARKEKNWSQKMLAEKCGISISFMGHIERGTRIMSLDTFVSLCNALGAGADEMLWGIPCPSDSYMEHLWENAKSKRSDSYLQYIKIMKSVAEIMSKA